MSNLNKTLRSRWLGLSVHTLLWLVLLFALAGAGLRIHRPPFDDAPINLNAVKPPVPVARLELLFAPTNYPQQVVDSSVPTPFYTKHFVPPPNPKPKPKPKPKPPPPPTTWKLELTYQGYYLSEGGPRYALLRMADKLVRVPVGGTVASNLFVLDATLKTLTLTNTAAQTNVLDLNVKKTIEVPFK